MLAANLILILLWFSHFSRLGTYRGEIITFRRQETFILLESTPRIQKIITVLSTCSVYLHSFLIDSYLCDKPERKVTESISLHSMIDLLFEFRFDSTRHDLLIKFVELQEEFLGDSSIYFGLDITAWILMERNKIPSLHWHSITYLSLNLLPEMNPVVLRLLELIQKVPSNLVVVIPPVDIWHLATRGMCEDMINA